MLYKINVEILLLHFKGTKIMNTEFVFKVKKEMYRIKKKKKCTELYRMFPLCLLNILFGIWLVKLG